MILSVPGEFDVHCWNFHFYAPFMFAFGCRPINWPGFSFHSYRICIIQLSTVLYQPKSVCKTYVHLRMDKIAYLQVLSPFLAVKLGSIMPQIPSTSTIFYHFLPDLYLFLLFIPSICRAEPSSCTILDSVVCPLWSLRPLVAARPLAVAPFLGSMKNLELPRMFLLFVFSVVYQ